MSTDKPSFGQELLWRLEAFGFDALTAVMRALPVDAASAFGGWLLRTLGPLTGSHRVAARNLELAFPNLPAEEKDRLLRASWDNIGRLFTEFPIVDKLTVASGRLEVVGGERLDALRETGRGMVLISGHFANWEVMAAAIMHHGVPCRVNYRAANNPYVDQRIRESRERYGIKLFAPKGGEGARELLESLKGGESVALLNDQKMNDGVGAPFFGRMVYTAPGPSRLALKFGTSLLPMSVQRVKGARFRVVVHEPIELERTGDRARDIEEGVKRVNAFIEARVRERPEDWFWVHKRWPKEAYASLRRRSDSRRNGPK